MAAVSRKGLDYLLLGGLDLVVPVVVNWKYHTWEATRTLALISGFASLVIFNAVIIAVIRTRDKQRGQGTASRFILSAVGLALLSALVTAIGLYSISRRTFSSYLPLVFSNIPLYQIHPEQRALTVAFLRRVAANVKVCERLAAQTKPLSPPLYSAESFSNERVILSVSDHYKEANADDFACYDQEEQIKNDFRNKMTKVDPDYLRLFEAQRREDESLEQKAYQLQREWFTATVALYDYAAAHTKHIVVKDGQLHFASETVRMEFSGQLEKSKSLHAQWREAARDWSARQKGLREELGLGPKS